MNTEIISLVIFGCVVGAVLMGRALSRRLPKDHLSTDTKETVKLSMGLLATMSALLLGLLVASAKGSYDNARSQVIQMAAKVVFLNRVLVGYGPEAEEVRARLHEAVEETVIIYLTDRFMGVDWSHERTRNLARSSLVFQQSRERFSVLQRDSLA